MSGYRSQYERCWPLASTNLGILPESALLIGLAVSPGFEPRPSLSVTRPAGLVPLPRECRRIRTPAFVERCSNAPTSRTPWVCRRDSNPGLR